MKLIISIIFHFSMSSLISPLLKKLNAITMMSRSFSFLQLPNITSCQSIVRCDQPKPKFLFPNSCVISQVCGFKVKLKLKRRCKDCYFVVREQRKYVICPTHPRHKQMSMVKKPEYTWILTHACQSKIRPW